MPLNYAFVSSEQNLNYRGWPGNRQCATIPLVRLSFPAHEGLGGWGWGKQTKQLLRTYHLLRVYLALGT